MFRRPGVRSVRGPMNGLCHVARGICERCRPPRERHNKYLPRKSSTALAARTPLPRPPRTMAASAATRGSRGAVARAARGRARSARRPPQGARRRRASPRRPIAPSRRRAGSVVLVDVSASPRAAASRRLARRVRTRARGPAPRGASPGDAGDAASSDGDDDDSDDDDDATPAALEDAARALAEARRLSDELANEASARLREAESSAGVEYLDEDDDGAGGAQATARPAARDLDRPRGRRLS